MVCFFVLSQLLRWDQGGNAPWNSNNCRRTRLALPLKTMIDGSHLQESSAGGVAFWLKRWKAIERWLVEYSNQAFRRCVFGTDT